MCKSIFVRATYWRGNPNPDLPDTVEFEVPPEFTSKYPTCTCEIAALDGDGATLRHTFVEECLLPFMQKVGCGDIIIEFR